MKEDILEQLVDDYLHAKGYFTQHNLKFRPRSDHPEFDRLQDSNHSDIDVVGYHPLRSGVDRVWVVSCKSWQAGFDTRAKLSEITNNKIRSGRESWRFFRELVQPKWSEAFCAAVERASGQHEFTYFTAVTRIKGDPALWERHKPFCTALSGNPIRLLSLEQMVSELSADMSTTVVPSQLGRTIQLLRASGATVGWPVVELPNNGLEPAARSNRGAPRLSARSLGRPTGGKSRIEVMMAELQIFYQLFLYTPEDSRFVFKIRVCPDVEQAHGRHEPTAVISSASLEPLTLCLRELGVTGYSRWPDEVGDAVSALLTPKLEYHECPPDEVVASLGSRPLSRVAHVTLIAADTSMTEMKRRIACLRAKAPRSVVIEEPA